MNSRLNYKTRPFQRYSSIALIVASLWCAALAPATRTQEQGEHSKEDEGGKRSMVASRFVDSRPAESNGASGQSKSASNQATGGSVAPGSKANDSLPARQRRHPQYRRASTSAHSGRAKASPHEMTAALRTPERLGVTIWRLRPVRQGESGARVLVHENSTRTQWTAERIEVDTPLKVGDRVRITIESPRVGYLYVVDREQYADGSHGESIMIFPTTRTRNGDNSVGPGRLIDIPAQEDEPNYFTLIPNPNRRDQVGEVLSIVVRTEPLPDFSLTDQPARFPTSQFRDWQQMWGSYAERYELERGRGPNMDQCRERGGSVRLNPESSPNRSVAADRLPCRQ